MSILEGVTYFYLGIMIGLFGISACIAWADSLRRHSPYMNVYLGLRDKH